MTVGRLREPARHEPPRPLRPHRPAAAHAARGARAAGGHRVLERPQVRPDALRRPVLRAPPLLALAGLRAVEAGQPPVHRRAAAAGGRRRTRRSRPLRPTPATRPPTSPRARPSARRCCARSLAVVDKVAGQPDHMGALPQLYAATMPDVLPDDYWGPDRLPRAARPPHAGRAHAVRAGRRRRPAAVGAQRGAHRRHLPLARPDPSHELRVRCRPWASPTPAP